MADDVDRRARLFLDDPNQPLDQGPFLRVISGGDTMVQQVASVVLALLIVVSATIVLLHLVLLRE